MANKLKLILSESAPTGDFVTVCLIGDGARIVPRLEKAEAASLIAAMGKAQFTGKSGKTLTLYMEDNTYLLVGIGETLEAGLDAETIGGKLFTALEATAQKRGHMPDHGLAEDVMADLLFGARLAGYHFEE